MEVVDFHAMGCPCRITVDVPAAAEAARAVVERLELRYSRYQADSELSRINRSAGTPEGCVVDAETAELLNFASAAHAQSGGRFDITSGVLRGVWDFRNGVVPDHDQVHACLERVGWQRVRWEAPGLWLPRGMELDFGGFVKEYAADAAVAAARAAGGRDLAHAAHPVEVRAKLSGLELHRLGQLTDRLRPVAQVREDVEVDALLIARRGFARGFRLDGLDRLASKGLVDVAKAQVANPLAEIASEQFGQGGVTSHLG